MSTTFRIYPGNDVLPLIEETRVKTEQLFQDFLKEHKIDGKLEVKAFYYGSDIEVPKDLRWETEMELAFGYYFKGEWVGTSFPRINKREIIEEFDLQSPEYQYGYPAHMLGSQIPLEADEFDVPISEEELDLLNSKSYYWDEYRSAGSGVFASTGYGFVAIALAQACDGRILSGDGAFNERCSGVSGDEALTFWGAKCIDCWGVDSYQLPK